jgi:hypothetical protein
MPQNPAVKIKKALISGFSKAVLLTLLYCLGLTEVDAQEKSYGLHAGMNFGILDNGLGPSLAFHYALRPQKKIQPEAAISFESQNGKTFLSGHSYNASALSLTAGLRLNFRPHKSWNPSLFLMPGMMSGTYQSSRKDDPGKKGLAAAVQFGISNTIKKSHMISLGFFGGEFIEGAALKYGFWF